ncbi:hypothetical protein ABZ154_23210 [Streptomyces sp. NPDC006261]|uniref:hypothetical protein n=1 Tax=Streptomyces sp. NPDC006261 TaxID=3156739 RepID=UPI0033AABEBE
MSDTGRGPRSGDRTRTRHDDALGELGCRPELKRALGNVHGFAAGTSRISFACHWFVQRHRTGVLAEHRSEAQDPTAPPSNL